MKFKFKKKDLKFEISTFRILSFFEFMWVW